jgi:hypothetical protein
VAAAAAPAALAELSSRVDELARRLDELASGSKAAEKAAPAEPAAASGDGTHAAAPRRRGRPPKARPAETTPAEATAEAPSARRVPLHEEIIAVIGERGPLTAAEIAQAITERGRYAPPRSARPLDAATVNSRVSNPAYRARFAREGGRIGLASGG